MWTCWIYRPALTLRPQPSWLVFASRVFYKSPTRGKMSHFVSLRQRTARDAVLTREPIAKQSISDNVFQIVKRRVERNKIGVFILILRPRDQMKCACQICVRQIAKVNSEKEWTYTILYIWYIHIRIFQILVMYFITLLYYAGFVIN